MQSSCAMCISLCENTDTLCFIVVYYYNLVYIEFFCCGCKAYPRQNAHCLVLTRLCADDDEKNFVKDYIQRNNIHIKLGMSTPFIHGIVTVHIFIFVYWELEKFQQNAVANNL